MPIPWRRTVAAGAAVAVAGGLLVQTSVGSAAETTAAICNLHCDGRYAQLAASERKPLTGTLLGRTFTAHVSDKDTMMWASVSDGQAGDEVWLDRSSDSCTGDAPSFKGAYIRALGALEAATSGAYQAYLKVQADTAYARNRNSFDAYGNHWAGPFVTTAHSCQHSVLDLPNAAS